MGQKPKFLGRYSHKLRVPSAAYPNFSFRQLQSASVGFRGRPWAIGNHLHIYRWGSDNNVCGRGAGSQSSWAAIYLKLKFPVLITPILASVSYRQIPSASVGFRGLWTPISSYIVGVQTTMYVGGWAEAKVPEQIFT